MLSECRPPRWKHAFYVMFSSGLIPMGYALYFGLVSAFFWSLVCGRLLADLDPHALVGIIFSDVRDNSITDNSTIGSTLGLVSYSLPLRNQGSRMRWTTRATQPI